MRKGIGMIPATLAFWKTLFRPNEPVSSVSAHGHPLLTGWPESPEDSWIRRVKELENPSGKKPRAGMYCVAGPHEGELMVLTKEQESLGCDVSSTRVITPAKAHGPFRYHLVFNGMATLTSEPGSAFKVNGLQTLESPLFDYDELELEGNRFLWLDFSDGGIYEIS